jgi:hypothetical protein
VILSPEEYERLAEIEEDYQLLLLAQQRIANGDMERTVTFNDAMVDLGISETELNEAEDVEIE